MFRFWLEHIENEMVEFEDTAEFDQSCSRRGSSGPEPETETSVAETGDISEQAIRPEAGEEANGSGEAEPIEKYSRPPPQAELRGEVFDARTPGKPWEDSVGGLLVAEETRRVFRQPLPDDETESLLNAMIGELHYNMREIAFRSMCHATQLDQRMQWIDASIKMAEAGAKVAQSIAHLRGAPITTERPRARKRR